MRKWKPSLALASLALALGCVELVGQRISVSYDAAADELHLLLFYDGIHDHPGRGKPGAEQIASFLRAGDFMFLDWYGHFEREKIERQHADPSTPAAQRALLQAILGSVRATPLGVYRNFDGELGAAQLVVISRASTFLAAANAAISEAIRRETSSGGAGEYPETLSRIARAAEAGHAWLALDGHSLVLSAPVHAREWAHLEARLFMEALDDIADAVLEAAGDGDAGRALRGEWRHIVQALSAAPISLQESSSQVTLRLGTPERPSTFRFTYDRTYEDNLAALLEASVAPLDPALADHALGDASARSVPEEALEAIQRWGPPEERVRALVHAAERGPQERRAGALRALRAFGESWNRDSVLPHAPARTDEPVSELEAWKGWYARMRAYPLER